MTPEQLAKSGSEHAHQVALFAWANMAARYGLFAANDCKCYTVKGLAEKCLHYYNDTIPELKLLFAIHNQGYGDTIRGANAKAEGVKTGVSDIMLPVTVFGGSHNTLLFAGLFIELKKPKVGKISDAQSDFAIKVEAQGYKVAFCYGWQNARDQLLNYLGR